MMNIVVLPSPKEGMSFAKQWLYTHVDANTVLFLSGGSAKGLYAVLAKEKRITPGAVALVDERFGPYLHETSNERMIAETGLLAYLNEARISWYPILQKNVSFEKTAQAYEFVLTRLFHKYPKAIAVVGIGKDGHTAGIAPNRNDFTDPVFASDNLVDFYDDTRGSFGKRITLSFKALGKMDLFLLWVFGDEKENAVQKLFEKGKREEIPARFYPEARVSGKVTLVTDRYIPKGLV